MGRVGCILLYKLHYINHGFSLIMSFIWFLNWSKKREEMMIEAVADELYYIKCKSVYDFEAKPYSSMKVLISSAIQLQASRDENLLWEC